MRSYTLLVFLAIGLMQGSIAMAQAILSGKVTNGSAPLPAATVSLLNASDSSWIKTTVTGDTGDFSFQVLAPGNYLITATSIGYETAMQHVVVTTTGNNNYVITLKKQSTSLQEITVAGKKPFIEMSLGKTIVNIESSPTTASTNALDLMRRLPGISVDMNGNITMQGKQGVLILINDRPTYLSGDDLAAYLKTITADEAAQIELITQPGAKYDAAGNTGIINIKLKRNKKQGLSGNVTLSYGHALYFNRNESFLINYKKNKLSLSLSGSDMEAIGFASWNEKRYFLDKATGKLTSASTDRSASKERFSNTALRLRADYDLTDKTTIGVNIRGTYHPNATSGYTSSINTDAANNLTYGRLRDAEGFIRKNVMANAYLSHKSTKESTFDVNFDYLAFHKKMYQDINNTTYDNQMQPLSDPLITHSLWPERINVYSVKVDQANTFKNGVKLETGIKSSWVTTDFIANVQDYQNNMWTPDAGLSNHFGYRENINAAYITLSKQLNKKWEAHTGLRAEQTNTLANQYTYNKQYARNYVSLFPTAYLTYKKDSNNQFELNYGRRIDRPDYDQLNPFVYYAFQNYYSVGNPYLQPQFSNNIELKHSYKNMLISTFSFSRTDDIIKHAVTVNDTTQTVYNTIVNQGTNQYIALQEVFNKDIFKWWSLNLSASAFYAQFAGAINTRDTTINFRGYSLGISTQFDFGKGWKAEGDANYFSNGRASLINSFDGNLYFELAASKKINDRFTVRAEASDPLNTYKVGIHINTGDYRSDAQFKYASQMFTLALTCNFGGKPVAEKQSKAIDEAGRIK